MSEREIWHTRDLTIPQRKNIDLCTCCDVVERLTQERDEARTHGCQDCAYEAGVAVPGPTGLCPKHADEQIDGRHSERKHRDEAHRQLAALEVITEAGSFHWDNKGCHRHAWDCMPVLDAEGCAMYRDSCSGRCKATRQVLADLPAAAQEIGAKLERAEKLAEALRRIDDMTTDYVGTSKAAGDIGKVAQAALREWEGK